MPPVSVTFGALEESAFVAPSILKDRYDRAITDLRVSITDRCNYRCVYCRTGNEGAQYSELPMADYLRLVRIFVDLGIERCGSLAVSLCCAGALWTSCASWRSSKRELERSSTWHLRRTAICSETWPHPSRRRPEPHYGQHGCS